LSVALKLSDMEILTATHASQVGGILVISAANFGLHLELSQLLGFLVALGFAFTIDQVIHVNVFGIT
jgi:hypothetical protein